MLRVPFVLDPRNLKLKCDILRPNSTKTATGNTLGSYSVYQSNRWFNFIDIGGQDQDLLMQDLSTQKKRTLHFRNDTIEVGWAIRYPKTNGDVYQITDIDVFDEADRRYMSFVVEKRNSATVVEIQTVPSAPRNLAVTYDDTPDGEQWNFTWDAPISDGYSPILRYQFIVLPDTEAESEPVTTSYDTFGPPQPGAHPPGTQVYVTAVNAMGVSPRSTVLTLPSI